jgi:hypothetical protein
VAKAEDLLNELRDQLDAGSLPVLRAASFAGLATATTAMASNELGETAPSEMAMDEPAEQLSSSSEEELF